VKNVNIDNDSEQVYNSLP